MDLYEMDLSLFGGDLLVGLQPPSSAELKAEAAAQDGHKSADGLTTSTVSSPWATTADLAPVSSLGQDELATSPSFDTAMVNQSLDVSWMDSRVDLLDLLAQEGEYAFQSSAVILPGVTTADTQEDHAIKVLQDMAEETSQMLAAGTDQDSPLDAAVVAQAATDTLQSVVDVDGAPTSVDHLLDMLTSGVDPSVDVLSATTDGDMHMQIDSADLLTTVTAEDVESILSSGPSSPAAPTQSSPYNDLPPEQSNSLLAKYLIGDIGTAQSPSPVSGSFDIADLDSLASDAQSDSDSDYMPSPSYRASKTRSTPYSRSKPKSGSKSKTTAMNKEARAVDRKLRKKQQNKDAATRYRQKKREEADQIDRECDELEERNGKLKDKVDQMTREIGYLKNLLAEVYRAKGLMAPKLGK